MNVFRGAVPVPRWIITIAAPITATILGGAITITGWSLKNSIDAVGDKAAEAIQHAKDAEAAATANSERLTRLETAEYSRSDAQADQEKVWQAIHQQALSVQDGLRGVERELAKLREEVAKQGVMK